MICNVAFFASSLSMLWLSESLTTPDKLSVIICIGIRNVPIMMTMLMMTMLTMLMNDDDNVDDDTIR